MNLVIIILTSLLAVSLLVVIYTQQKHIKDLQKQFEKSIEIAQKSIDRLKYLEDKFLK